MEKDLTLALKTLKKFNTEINVASSDHCNTYAKEHNKRKRVEEENEYVMAHGLDVCTDHVDMFKQELQHKQHLCKEFLEELEKKRTNNPVCRSKCMKKQPVKIVEIKRKSKSIFLPLPKLVKKMISMKFIPCNKRMALQHVTSYKKGNTL
eukprot:12491426-Ditylum_brightwellii.AAC.1